MNTVNCMACGHQALEKDFFPHDCPSLKRKRNANTTTIKDDELDEILFMAFVGHFVRDPDGNFVSLDDKFGVLKDALKADLQTYIEDKVKEARIDELVHVTVVDGMLMTTLPETGTLHSIGDRMYTLNKEALKDKSKEVV